MLSLWAGLLLAAAPQASASPSEECAVPIAVQPQKGPPARAGRTGKMEKEEEPQYRSAADFREEMLRQLHAPPPLHVEPEDPDPFAFSTFRGQRPERMGRQTEINGAVFDIASLQVELPPHLVEEEYILSLAAKGVLPLRAVLPNTRGVRYLSFRPEGSRNLKTLTLVPAGAGTVILASVGDPSPMVEPAPAVPRGFPLPPRAEAGVQVNQIESGGSRSSTFRVPQATTRQLRAFYRTELPRQGYALEDEAEDTDRYARGDESLRVSVREDAAVVGSVIVTIIWGR